MKYKMKDFEFSKNSLKKQIYNLAVDDFDGLYEFMELDKFDFKKLDDMVNLESHGKHEYNFEWNSLIVAIERTKDTYKIKQIEVYDLKTQEFLCYMKLKNTDNKK